MTPSDILTQTLSAPVAADAAPHALHIDNVPVSFPRARLFAALAGVAGLALCGVGWLLDARQFYFSYLAAWVFWVGLSLGSLCVLMIHALTGGGWGYLIRRFLEASANVVPALAALFLPLCFGMRQLYPWANSEVAQHIEALHKKHAYLNVPAFAARMVIFFALFAGAAWYLARQSRAQDRTADPAPTRRLRTFSGPGLLLFTLVGSLATVDWLMVLEPVFYSTVFPAQLMIGWILSTFAFCVVALSFVRDTLPWRGLVQTKHFHSLGNFVLAFVMMWAYLAVSQLIVIWSGNLPKEIGWYLHRVAGGWKAVAIGLGLFHFFVPFFVLLSREAKESVRLLRIVALAVLAVHMVEMWWQVEPSMQPGHFGVSWLTPAAFVGVGGVWLAVFLSILGRHAPIPLNDPRMEEALAHGH